MQESSAKGLFVARQTTFEMITRLTRNARGAPPDELDGPLIELKK